MEMKDQKQASLTADGRMKLIAPLLVPNIDKQQMQELRRAAAEVSGQSQRTIDRYLKLYTTFGFEGLKPKGKNPTAKYKIPEDIVQKAIDLRRELPSRSVTTIIRILEMEGTVEKGFLKRSTLQEALQRNGFSASKMQIYSEKNLSSHRFQRKHRNDLWQGDIKYGPILKINGKSVQTYMSSLIDDCTRYIVHAEFYTNMQEEIVEDTLRKAVSKYGSPARIAFDNGSQYRTHWMKRACDLLGIKLIYMSPRNPQGKGKQERFNRTVDSFIEEVKLNLPDSVDVLNEQFSAWLETCYTTQGHSAIGTTPEIAFKSDSMPLRFVAKDVMARAFLHCNKRKVDKSGIISFSGKRYEVGIKYAGENVDVVYDPANPNVLSVEPKGALPFQVFEVMISEHTAKKAKTAVAATIPVDRSRLLDAAIKNATDDINKRRHAISYIAEAKE